MDVSVAVELMLRDLRELFGFRPFGIGALAATAALPVVSLALVLRGRRLPILAFLVSAWIWLGWFGYYAVDLFPNPGMYGFGFIVLGSATGWGLVLLSLAAPWRRGPFPELLDVSWLRATRQ